MLYRISGRTLNHSLLRQRKMPGPGSARMGWSPTGLKQRAPQDIGGK